MPTDSQIFFFFFWGGGLIRRFLSSISDLETRGIGWYQDLFPEAVYFFSTLGFWHTALEISVLDQDYSYVWWVEGKMGLLPLNKFMTFTRYEMGDHISSFHLHQFGLWCFSSFSRSFSLITVCWESRPHLFTLRAQPVSSKFHALLVWQHPKSSLWCWLESTKGMSTSHIVWTTGVVTDRLPLRLKNQYVFVHFCLLLRNQNPNPIFCFSSKKYWLIPS